MRRNSRSLLVTRIRLADLAWAAIHRSLLPIRLGVYVAATDLFVEEERDEEAEQADDDGIPQTAVDIAGGDDEAEGDGGKQTTKPADAEVVRERHSGIADARGEEFHQGGGQRSVNQE